MNIFATLRRRGALPASVVSGLVVLGTIMGAAAATRVTLPLLCNKGPDGQRFEVAASLPHSVEPGAIYTIRLDGSSSGKISHFGLNYLHDMRVDYLLPPDMEYVEGSATLVAGTGTPNVMARAHVRYHAGVVTMELPGKVENGTMYTPPSITLQVRAVGAPGSSAAVSLNHFQLVANAFVVGDVAISCDPVPRPYPIGATTITRPVALPVR